MLERYGMPRSALTCAGRFTWQCEEELADFQAWVRARGTHAYARLLLTHPAFAARMLWRAWDAAIGGEGLELYGDPEEIRRAHAQQSKVFALPLLDGRGSFYPWARTVSDAAAAICFTRLLAPDIPYRRVLSFIPFAAFGILIAPPRVRRTSLLPAWFFVGVVLSQLPVVLADPAEIPRHALLASVSLNLLALFVLCAAARLAFDCAKSKA
jgi:hypothetical protein